MGLTSLYSIISDFYKILYLSLLPGKNKIALLSPQKIEMMVQLWVGAVRAIGCLAIFFYVCPHD